MIYVFVEIVIMIDPDSTQPIDINTDDQNKKPPFKIATGEYFTWISSGITSVGNVRQINEDALLEYPEKMIWAVADGMGGHECGDIASKTTVDYLRTSKVDIVQPFAFQYVIGSEFWHEAVDSGQLKPDDIYAYNDKKYGTSPYTAKELFDKVLEAEDLINSPVLNPGRYVRLVGKFVKQKKWRVIWKNILQLPKIIQGLLLEHPYDIVIEDELNA